MEDIRDTSSKTLSQLQVETLNTIQGGVIDLEDTIYHKYMALWTLIWKNPDLEPKLVVEGLGSKALSLFQLAGVLSSFLNEHISDREIPGIPDYYLVVFDVDSSNSPTGMATVTIKPKVPATVPPSPNLGITTPTETAGTETTTTTATTSTATA